MSTKLEPPSRKSRPKKSRGQPAPSSANVLEVLQLERKAHLRELDELRSELKETPETQIEQADPGVSEKAKDLALMRQIEEHVTAIDQALAAAQQGMYGICERCGRPIDPERLRILPAARLCAGCKSQAEKTAHHHGRRL